MRRVLILGGTGWLGRAIAQAALRSGAHRPLWLLASTASPRRPRAHSHFAGRYVQVIDVDDLAEWIIRAGQEGTTGAINALGNVVPFGEFLELTAEVAEFTGDFEQRDDAWLASHKIHYWAGPRSLPLWIPLSDSGFAQRNNERYRAADGELRALSETITRTLDDELSRGRDRPRKSGLTAKEEARTLKSTP